jgi:hypothetical protein
MYNYSHFFLYASKGAVLGKYPETFGNSLLSDERLRCVTSETKQRPLSL